MNKIISFVFLDFYSYWYHRLCHKYNSPWHAHHHNIESNIKQSCLIESMTSGTLIFGGIRIYEFFFNKVSFFHKVCRKTCGLYWLSVSSFHYLNHTFDMQNTPYYINKIRAKHLSHHQNQNLNYSVVLPFDILFATDHV
jgi:sterol desaturase/sphingolipid hydroxylase (fatty acid hydroxylase superfamily)